MLCQHQANCQCRDEREKEREKEKKEESLDETKRQKCGFSQSVMLLEPGGVERLVAQCVVEDMVSTLESLAFRKVVREILVDSNQQNDKDKVR